MSKTGGLFLTDRNSTAGLGNTLGITGHRPVDFHILYGKLEKSSVDFYGISGFQTEGEL